MEKGESISCREDSRCSDCVEESMVFKGSKRKPVGLESHELSIRIISFLNMVILKKIFICY